MNPGLTSFRFLRHSLFILPLLISVIISVYIITFHHVWPLSRDQWHMYAPYFEKGLWDAALTPMSNHRHLFPFLFFHADMAWFGGRNHLLVAVGACFDIAIIALLLAALLRDSSFSVAEKNIFAVWIIFLLTWLINIAQLGWGFMSTQYYLSILTYLLAILAAWRYCFLPKTANRMFWLVVMLVCGFICTFSFGSGILVWPALLFFAWFWRVPAAFLITLIFSLLICLAVFLLLPGGDTIEGALLLAPANTFDFLFHLPAGPIYYLLKSFHFLDVGSIKAFASFVSIIAVSTTILLLGWLLIKRPALLLYSQLNCALILLGLGTAMLISFTRNTLFLDVWVDRYQIWAVMFWLGFIPLCYQIAKICRPEPSYARKYLLIFLWSLPLIALPSQLDMGARLAEYKIRVQESLLSYEVGIPDKQSAEDALHWNWEYKLSSFFTVWQHIKTEKKNIFYGGYADYLGKPVRELLSDLPAPRTTNLKVLHSESIVRSNLLDLSSLPEASSFAVFAGAANDQTIGFRIFAKVPEEIHWQYAVFVDENEIVNGLGIHVSHSILPRGNGRNINKDYNLFAVVQKKGGTRRCYILNNNDKGDVFVSDLDELSQ